jgi:XTP/dITP diphosphohydrolase
VRILLATTNQSKIAELQEIMGNLDCELIGLTEADSTQEIEVASTFAENSLLKARHYHRVSGLPTIADDSGLEVEALGGAPGAYSARYAGPEASDADRIAKLLDDMKAVPPDRRGARFVCAAALVWDQGEKIFQGEVNGVILDAPRGSNGFGYDPVFLFEPLKKTFAELPQSEKKKVSHRGRAFGQLAAWLIESGPLDTLKSNDRIVTTAE